MNKNNLIKGYDIVVVGQQPWDVEIGSNCKDIALEFSKNNRVLYVNRPLDRATRFFHSAEPNIQKRILIINHQEPGLSQVQENLWVYYSDTIVESINWIGVQFIYNAFNKINNKRLATAIKKATKELGFKNFILFNDNDIYNGFYLKELLKPLLSIYYSRDYLLTVDYWKRHGKRLEPILMAKSDMCVANSVKLANNCRQYNKNSYYVGQGCNIDDFTHFKGEVPADITHIKKPVIGYIGVVQTLRLDLEMLKYIAIKKPGYSIVLVGPEDDNFKNSDLHALKNIHFLGIKPASLMPAYINSFDVCLNPQIINEITIGNYPRKVDEYLAMGKPVVATRTEAMSVFEDYTYLCDTREDYVQAIGKALQEDSTELHRQRIAFASTHTWENSVLEIYKAIHLTLNKPPVDIKEKPIVIFSNMRYESPIEATSLFLARNLAEKTLVYYVQYPYTARDYASNRNSKEFLSIKKSFFNASHALLDTDIPNLKKLILPILAPINFISEGKVYRRLLKLNEYIIIKRIKSILKRNKIVDFIFINSFNFHYPDIGKALKPALTIYQCVDPMITPYDIRHGIVSELQLVKESDVVICTSKALCDEKSKINPNTYLVTNAADLSHSSKALDERLTIHEKLKNIPKPIIGYVGSIERRIDYDLIKVLIKSNPDKSFVFIGPVFNEHIPEWFFKSPNIYLPGPIPYEELPAVLKGFDIAVIPFKKDEVSSTIFPLKLFEYLGAGRPVIVNDFNPDLKAYTGGAVSFCSNASEFSDALNDILKNDNAEKLTERLKIAKLNTWQARSDEIINIIKQNLRKKDK